MPTYSEGEIVYLKRIKSQVNMKLYTYIGGREIRRCMEAINQLENLEGRTSWHCSTLRLVNNIITELDRCPRELIVYLLITKKLGLPVRVRDYYSYEDKNVYYVNSKADIDSACSKFFKNKPKKRIKSRFGKRKTRGNPQDERVQKSRRYMGNP